MYGEDIVNAMMAVFGVGVVIGFVFGLLFCLLSKAF